MVICRCPSRTGELSWRSPVAIFCTTENDSDEIALAVNAGANDFLLKPFDRESLENKLAEVGLLGGERAGHARL